MKKCKECFKLLQKKQKLFCSRSCANSFNNSKNPKRKSKARICVKCGIKFIKPRNTTISRYCPQCRLEISKRYEKYKNYTLEQLVGEISVKGKHPSWKYAEVRNLNRSWNKQLTTKPCSVCGYNKHVELAHIKPISSFPLTATMAEINSIDNVVQLCRNCHWEFDHGLVTLSS